ncbi:hypothetical protein [Fodinibius sp. Rm-B-1B1-1]|uniref:hypothetical protein n=1 Tax=Fodinibius alkaliphilus TaxID=3140241 RepID=UPI003159CADA
MMKSIISTVGVSIAWSVLAAVIGTACWILLLTIIHPLTLGESLTEIINHSKSTAIGALYFGGFIAFLFSIPYSLIFIIYLTFKGKFWLSDKTKVENAISTFVLSLPLVITVFISTVMPTGSLGPFWRRGFELSSWVLIAAWVGILISRLLINPLINHRKVAV